MNSDISDKSNPLVEEESTNRVAFRLDQLRTKLLGFNVVERQGRFVGEVNDLILDNQQHLKIVISQPDVNQKTRFFLLSSQFVNRVKSRSRTLLINLTQADIRRLPEYQPPMQSSNENSQNPLGSITIEQGTQLQEIDNDTLEELENQPIPAQAQGTTELSDIKATSQEVVQEESIQLLEERLKVEYTRRKVGEVIVRKEIETRIIEVPVRREKLIVEQISPERKQLAEIDLGESGISDLELRDYIPNNYQISNHIISGEFDSPKTAAWLLDAIAHQLQPGCKRIRVEIELEDSDHYELYKGWFDRCSTKKSS